MNGNFCRWCVRSLLYPAIHDRCILARTNATSPRAVFIPACHQARSCHDYVPDALPHPPRLHPDLSTTAATNPTSWRASPGLRNLPVNAAVRIWVTRRGGSDDDEVERVWVEYEWPDHFSSCVVRHERSHRVFEWIRILIGTVTDPPKMTLPMATSFNFTAGLMRAF
jgi:hypothetical protein